MLLPVAIKWRPSLDEARDDQELLGALVGVQVSPELVEVKILSPKVPAASLVPSDDGAMHVHVLLGAPVATQFVPKFVDLKINPPYSPAKRLLPSAEIATTSKFWLGEVT